MTGHRGRNSSVCISTKQRTGRSWYESQQGQEIFIFPIESRPALEPTHPPIQWEPRVKLQEFEADDSVHLVSRLRMEELHLHSSTCLHGPVLSYIIKCSENFTFMTSYECKLDYQGLIPDRGFSLLSRPCPDLFGYPLSPLRRISVTVFL